MITRNKVICNLTLGPSPSEVINSIQETVRSILTENPEIDQEEIMICAVDEMDDSYPITQLIASFDVEGEEPVNISYLKNLCRKYPTEIKKILAGEL